MDATADRVINEYSVDPDKLETAYTLAFDPERRVQFQADIQDYVDMGISSTLNLPEWGSPANNEDTVSDLSTIIARYCHRLRGITVYPNGARGGQPLTEMDYREALKHKGVIFDESEDGRCIGGVCGV